AEIPGIDPKELSVTVTGDVLTLEGEKQSEHEEEGKSYHLVERSYGKFRRSISLPGAVDPSRVEASGKDGILTIHLAKREETKPKTIDVTVS
ncbi:MAG: Hsp20/alpha crystallin family protein, partial [Planctomycetota bacterium]